MDPPIQAAHAVRHEVSEAPSPAPSCPSRSCQEGIGKYIVRDLAGVTQQLNFLVGVFIIRILHTGGDLQYRSGRSCIQGKQRRLCGITIHAGDAALQQTAERGNGLLHLVSE